MRLPVFLVSFGAAAIAAPALGHETSVVALTPATVDQWQVVTNDGAVAFGEQTIFSWTEAGEIRVYANGIEGERQPFGYLQTKAAFADYEITLEYKWGEKRFPPFNAAPRNAGLLYNITGPLTLPDGTSKLVWPTALECQIMEGDAGDFFLIGSRGKTRGARGRLGEYDESRPIDTIRGMGAEFDDLYPNDVIKNGGTYERPGWNKIRVIVRGGNSEHWVNGTRNNALFDAHWFDRGARQWRPLTGGHVAVQAEGTEIFYRNITIRPLAS